MRKFRDTKNKNIQIKKKPEFTKQLVSKNIFVLNYSSHQKMCNAVMRFLSTVDIFPHLSEPMSLAAFKREYKKKYGSFSFTKDWDGFVVPGHAFAAFDKGNWDPLSKQEKLLLKSFKNQKDYNFAVIAISSKSSPTTLKHEMAHALFEVNPDYKNEVLRLINTVDLRPVFKILKSHGYEECTIHDEAHAYLMNNLSWLESEGLRNIRSYYEVCAKLNYLFEKYI